jgi:hypothetical protein
MALSKAMGLLLHYDQETIKRAADVGLILPPTTCAESST